MVQTLGIRLQYPDWTTFCFVAFLLALVCCFGIENSGAKLQLACLLIFEPFSHVLKDHLYPLLVHASFMPLFNVRKVEIKYLNCSVI